jgi:hypothetical protein
LLVLVHFHKYYKLYKHKIRLLSEKLKVSTFCVVQKHWLQKNKGENQHKLMHTFLIGLLT